MPTAYTTLTMISGSIGADLVDGDNYQLMDGSWGPAVAARRVAKQAGMSPYMEVVEEIRLVVRGTSAAIALENLAKLTRLMDLADQFAAGDLVTPVLLSVQPQGSVLTAPVTAVVLGRAGDGGGWMSLPVTFSDHLMLFEIAPVTLRFLRSGLWYGAVDTASATAASNASIRAVTMGGILVIPGPTTIKITDFDNDTAELAESYVFVASDSYGAADSLQVVEGESGSPDAGGVTLTSTADSGNKARGNAVGRISDPSTTDFEGVSFLLPAPVDARRAYLFAAVRKQQAGPTWYVYGSTKGSSGQDGSPTGVVKISGASTQPRLVPLGICYNSENQAAIRLFFKCSTTSGSPTLDVDYIAIMGMDFQHSFVVHLLPRPGISVINEIVIDPEALTAVAPSVMGVDDTVLPADYPIGYDSDAWLATNTDEIKVAWFATRGAHWRWTKADDSVLSAGVTVTRRWGYLTPQ